MRAKVENLTLEELYKDYDRLKYFAEKYYYTTAYNALVKGRDELLDVLKEQITKRKLVELENQHTDGLIEKAVNKMRKTCAVPIYQHIQDKNYSDNVNVCDIVYTTDNGQTFKCCTENEWKYDMGVKVGWVTNSTPIHKFDGDYYTICANKVFDDLTLYCGELELPPYAKEFFQTTTYEVGNDYNGFDHTNTMCETMYGKNKKCALDVVWDYNIEGVDDDMLNWYIPSCGELKYFSENFSDKKKLELNIQGSDILLSSNLRDKQTKWVYSLLADEPVPNSLFWEGKLLPFAKIKIEH